MAMTFSSSSGGINPIPQALEGVGEILNASDWGVYDEEEKCQHWTFNHTEEE